MTASPEPSPRYRAVANALSRLRSRLSDAYWERRTNPEPLTPERQTRLLARLDQALAANRDKSRMVVCDDPENCQPYGEHYQQLHGKQSPPAPTRPAEGRMGEDGWLTCDDCGHTWHPSGFPTHRCRAICSQWCPDCGALEGQTHLLACPRHPLHSHATPPVRPAGNSAGSGDEVSSS